MATTAWLRGPAIGCGATATVSIAAAAATGDVFAVKSAQLSRSGTLQREQSILSSVKSPFILSCLGFEIAPGSGGAFYNLFLEYAAGGSLSDEIKRSGGCLRDAQIRSRTHEILSGIVDLHDAGVVHCDVKPDNVLIGSNGRAKIGDLGCARLISDGKREIRGSPMYMAPEVVRGEEQGMSADVWALGCVVVEMATGRPPWPDVTDVAAGIRQIGFSGDVPAIPDSLSDEAKDFVNNCLRTDPTERWTADELLHHSFIKTSSSVPTCVDSIWVSPKSTLDLGFWESMEVDQEDEEELSEEAAGTIIHELAAGSNAPDWCWDEDWEDVRNTAGECTAETGFGSGEVAASEFLTAKEGPSTSYREEFAFGPESVSNESCEYCQWEEWNREMFCCKSRNIEFRNKEEGQSLGLQIYAFAWIFLLSFCFWPFMPFESPFVAFIPCSSVALLLRQMGRIEGSLVPNSNNSKFRYNS